MAKLWSPDTCTGPAGGINACLLEVLDGHTGMVRIVRLCPHHTTLRAGMASDEELWTAMLAKNRQKNAAVNACVTSLGRLASTFLYSVGADDRVTITVTGTTANRTTARTAVDTAVGGTGRVLIV